MKGCLDQILVKDNFEHIRIFDELVHQPLSYIIQHHGPFESKPSSREATNLIPVELDLSEPGRVPFISVLNPKHDAKGPFLKVLLEMNHSLPKQQT